MSIKHPNPIERMVAENRQTIASKELAKAISMNHSKFRRFLVENRFEIETKCGLDLRSTNGCFALTFEQAFLTIHRMRLGQEKTTLQLHLIRKNIHTSLRKAIQTKLNAQRHITGLTVRPFDVSFGFCSFEKVNAANYVVKQGE